MRNVGFVRRVKDVVLYVFYFIVLFGFMFEVPMPMGLTSRRLALVVAIITLVFKRDSLHEIYKCLNKRKLNRFIISFIIIILLSILQTLSGSQNIVGEYVSIIEPWYYVYMIGYILVFSLYCVVVFDSVKQYSTIIIGILLLQSAIVIYAISNPTFRMLIYEFGNLNEGKMERTIENGTRVVGFLMGGADGSVIMSISCILLLLLRRNNQINRVVFYILYVFFIIITAFVGRTGILVEGALLIYDSLSGKNKIRNLAGLFVSAVLAVVILTSVLNNASEIDSEHYLEWMTEFLDKDSRESINQGVIQEGFPPLNSDLIFGTGLASGYSYGGKSYYSDSGYVRAYTSIGIVGMILYYWGLLNLLKSPSFKRKECFFTLLIIIAFVIEYKEPFMMKYVFPWAVLTCFLLSVKDKRRIMVMQS